MSKRRFVLRTIRNGAVKISGETFKPSLPFPDHYEGARAAFGLYYEGKTWRSDFVHLWGSEEEYKQPETGAVGFFADEGEFKWEWWERVP